MDDRLIVDNPHFRRDSVAAPTYGSNMSSINSALEALDSAVALLAEADAFARGLDARVRQVTISIAGDHQQVEIVRRGGATFRDDRPLVRFNVSVVTEQGGRRGTGGRSTARRASTYL